VAQAIRLSHLKVPPHSALRMNWQTGFGAQAPKANKGLERFLHGGEPVTIPTFAVAEERRQ